MKNHMKENESVSSFISNKKEREFNLMLEHRYYLQEHFSKNYEFISKTEVIDQESLKNVEEKEMEQEDIIDTMEQVDEELFNMLKNNTYVYNKQKKTGDKDSFNNIEFAKISYV